MISTEIQELIDEAEAALAASQARAEDLRAELEEVREEISHLQTELRAASDDAAAEIHAIRGIIAINERQRSWADVPAWAEEGIRDIEAATAEAYTFAQSQLNRLETAVSEAVEIETAARSARVVSLMGAERGGSRLPNVTPPASTSYTPGPMEAPPHLVSVAAGEVTLTPLLPSVKATLVAETTYAFEVGDKRGTIPYRVFSLTGAESLQDANPEEAGVRVTAEMLAAEGRSCIIALGGASRPDIVSLDRSGKLWVTEVKGTFKGTPLPRAGLLRTLKPNSAAESAAADPLTGTLKVWENSPEWLRRSGVDVLRNFTAIEATVDDAILRATIHELTLRYAQAVISGFEEDNYCTEIFQVGVLVGSESLPSLDPDPTLHAYCADVEPTRITQVTTGEEAVI